ncbi:tetratricopeptide repeat protein [Leptolyngbya sp. GB1-A1]|uniref:tetratricopeptide repeat protein n=1 Tax=Leptolyngbya sp. GB1-A1 TaxID=2933908 RepID=UPI0032969A84
MKQQNTTATQTAVRSLAVHPHLILVEAEPGPSRRHYLQQQLEQSQQDDTVLAWFLSCNYEEGGHWAGLKELLADLIPEVLAHVPELLTKHHYELVTILPFWRRTLSFQGLNQTDKSFLLNEQTRYYQAERALRIIHGVINLITNWFNHVQAKQLLLVCDDYERASSLVKRFLFELMRRRGQHLNLQLLIATTSKESEALANHFGSLCAIERMCLLEETRSNSVPISENFPSEQESARSLQELEQQIGKDSIELESNLPQLIRFAQLSNQPEKVLEYQIAASTICISQGFYEDALVYAEQARLLFQRYPFNDEEQRWTLYANLYKCYTALGYAQLALEIAEYLMATVHQPEYRYRVYYMMAMMYARYLPEQDFSKAEDYLNKGLEQIAQTNYPRSKKLFHTAFNRNGLALVRHRQKRPYEAAELCRTHYEKLDNHLKPDEHILHRSVLLYNIAQVYASLGSHEQAISYFSGAIAMDPNYSEYYNDRATVLVRMEQFEQALEDYFKAIELSAPYPIVWSNLGHCYRQMGEMEKAVDAYCVALDLDPNQFPILVARAQAFEGLEQFNNALADYNAALTLNPDHALVLANRAALYYDLERYQESLNDLDHAISISPETADFYHNRAIVLGVLST